MSVFAIDHKKKRKTGRKTGAFRHYQNMAIEGGGVLGIAYLGALKELFADGSIDAFDCFAGSSAGSLIAILLACGADYDFMYNTIWDFDISKLKDRTWFGEDIIRFVSKFGFYKGDRLMQFIEDTLFRLIGIRNPTFSQIMSLTGNKLVITGANVSRNTVEYFTPGTHPDMSAALAVRISCSIPYFFKPVKLEGDYYVDGGVLDNYPIHFFDRNECFANTRTLGLKLISNEDLKAESGLIDPIRNIKDFTASLINCMHNQAQKVHVKKGDWDRTVCIHTGDLSYIDFDITMDEKRTLMEAGKRAIYQYIVRRNSVKPDLITDIKMYNLLKQDAKRQEKGKKMKVRVRVKKRRT